MKTMTRTPVALALSIALVPTLAPSVAHAQVPPPPSGPAPEAAPEPEPEPAPSNENLSEEEKLEKAKGLYVEAEGDYENGDYQSAVVKYEEAYYLVPGKHGFAYKVGISAWKVGDCNKANDYLKHFLQYEDDREGKADWIDEAKKILGEIAVQGCAEEEKPAAPAPGPVVTDTGDDGPDLTSAKDKREAEAAKEREKTKQDGVSGLMIGGIILSVLGVGGVAAGGATLGIASSRASDLESASSEGPTGFPAGDYSDQATYDKDQSIDGLNIGTVVGLSAGSVLLAGGITMIVLDVTRKKKAQRAQNAKAGSGPQLTNVGPTVTRGGAGLSAKMRF